MNLALPITILVCVCLKVGMAFIFPKFISCIVEDLAGLSVSHHFPYKQFLVVLVQSIVLRSVSLTVF